MADPPSARARVRHAVATCAGELRDVAAAGLRLGVAEFDELAGLLDQVAPFGGRETSGSAE